MPILYLHHKIPIRFYNISILSYLRDYFDYTMYHIHHFPSTTVTATQRIALKQIKHRVKHNIHINLDDDCKAISIHILNNMLRNETKVDKESFILRHELRLLDLCNLKLHLKRNDAKFRSKLFQYLNKIIT